MENSASNEMLLASGIWYHSQKQAETNNCLNGIIVIIWSYLRIRRAPPVRTPSGVRTVVMVFISWHIDKGQAAKFQVFISWH